MRGLTFLGVWMLKRNLLGLVAALGLLLPSISNGENWCTRVFADLNRQDLAYRFWGRTGAYAPEDGSRKTFKFGFDAELWSVADIVGIIEKDPESFRLFKAKLERTGPKLTLAQIGTMTGWDAIDALRARSRKNDGRYTLADIKTEALHDWENSNAEKSRYADLAWKYVDSSLKNRNIPVSAILETDSGAGHEHSVELVMDGATASPKAFKKLIDWLYTEVKNPETHFHVSVPTAHIEPDQMVFAARALETKILLDQMVYGKEYGTDHYGPYDATAFSLDLREVRNEEEPQVERGIVRVESYRWKGPKAHDIEIRDWFDKDNGLENVHFMMELVRNAEHLRDSSNFKARELRNTMPPNLNGALRYAALMMRDRLPANKSHIPRDLEAFAARLESQGRVTPADHSAIRDYLRQQDVLQYLSLHTFLEE